MVIMNQMTEGLVPVKYKYIQIKQIAAELFSGKPVYRIYNNKSQAQIGIISWYPPWKQYVFSSQPECIFNNSCLRDVLDFIENKIPK
jgi:hypothetical protein